MVADETKANKELAAQSTVFNLSAWARNRVDAKRKRKGLGELTPRENNPYRMFATYGMTVGIAKTLFAPLDRLRILSQVRHMSSVAAKERVTGSSMANMNKIISEQGFWSLWRGNNSNVYRNLLMISLQVSIYDKIKHAWMPNNAATYSGADYYMRLVLSACCNMGLTAAFVYPLDLINTRIASDMSKSGQPRLFKTTFDCFNRTNIDEGFRAGLYKGLELSIAASAIRSLLALPLYDAVRNQSSSFSHFGFDKIGVSMFTSLIMSLLVYPLDTAKRCMQLNGARGHFSLYKGSVDCL